MQNFGYFINSKWELCSRTDSKLSLHSGKSVSVHSVRTSQVKSDVDRKTSTTELVQNTERSITPAVLAVPEPQIESVKVSNENQIPPKEIPRVKKVPKPAATKSPAVSKPNSRPPTSRKTPDVASKPASPNEPVNKPPQSRPKTEETPVAVNQDFQLEPLSASQLQTFAKPIQCFSEKTIQLVLAKQMEPKEQGLAQIAAALESFLMQARKAHLSPVVYEPLKNLAKVSAAKPTLDEHGILDSGFILVRKLTEDSRDKVGGYALALMEILLCTFFTI